MTSVSTTDENQDTAPRGDLYHHGMVSKLFPSNNMGLVRTESGREVPFSFELVILVGAAKSPHDLKEGQEVGYDLGWTGNGLRVIKIKSYPPPPDDAGQGNLEGKGGQGEDLPT
jgi:hypothetical protein